MARIRATVLTAVVLWSAAPSPWGWMSGDGGCARAHAAERAEAYLYVLENVDHGGQGVPLIVPVANKAVSDAGPSTRATKAFEALRARSPKAYGATSLRIDSATRATLILDKVADADQVVAEVYWSLSACGVTELLATPFFKDAVSIDDLSYGAAATVLPLWDVLRFHDQQAALGGAFVLADGVPAPGREVLGRIAKGDPTLRKALAALLTGKAIRPKLAYLDAITDPRAREALRFKADDAAPALEDTAAQVRSAALDAVIAAGIQGNKVVQAALDRLVEGDSDGETKLRAVKALSKAGVTKYADLLESEKLKSGSARDALEAVEKLSKSTQPKIAGPALVGALSHSDRGVRDSAFKALVDLKLFELLSQALKGDLLSAEMREQIATVLVDNGSPTAQEEALNYLITKGKAGGAILACQTWGKRGVKSAAPALIDALKHDSAEVRGAAAEALAALKDERAIAPLADAAEAKARDKETMLKAASEILASLSLDKVKSLVSSKNVTVRQMAIRALAEFAKGSKPRPDVVAILQEARKDADVNIKRSAVYALARLQDDGIARDLAEMKKDSDAEVRIQVAVAQGSASEKVTEAATVLEEMIADADKRVRVEAIRGLGKRKATSALPKLVGLTRQPDMDIKRAVFETLLALRTADNSKDLRLVFQKGMETRDTAVKTACVTALAEQTSLADFEALRLATDDPSKQVKLTAIAALVSAKSPEAIEVLASFTADADIEVRQKAVEAICATPHDGKEKSKRDALKDVASLPDTPAELKKTASKCAEAVGSPAK